MASSASSSAKGTSPSTGDSPSTPTRKSFALTGRSRALDPRTNAVRSDLADVRLAEYVFAPHYAAPSPRRLINDAPLRAERGDGDVLATLASGEGFELLDVTGDTAWGVATAHGLVGYVDAAALGPDA